MEKIENPAKLLKILIKFIKILKDIIISYETLAILIIAVWAIVVFIYLCLLPIDFITTFLAISGVFTFIWLLLWFYSL